MLTYIAFHHVVGVLHDVTGQAEVTDLGLAAVCQEHVPGGHVSVDALNTHTHTHTHTHTVCPKTAVCCLTS